MLLQTPVLRVGRRRLLACVIVGLLLWTPVRGWAGAVPDGGCPAGDIAAGEYFGMDPAGRTAAMEAYRRRFEPAMKAVVARLRNLFDGKPVKVQFRLKPVASMQEKLVRKGYRCLSQMTDIAGVRVLMLDYAAIPFVTQAVQAHFPVREKQDLIDDPRGNGYRAIHYLVEAAGRIVELQVHTVRGTLWALMSHFLVYKGPYRSDVAVVRYFKALSDALYLLDSGFEHQSLPPPTGLPPRARSEIRGGLLLIQAYDDERWCPDHEGSLRRIERSVAPYRGRDYYGMDEFEPLDRPPPATGPAPARSR